MNIEIKIDGLLFVNADIDFALLSRLVPQQLDISEDKYLSEIKRKSSPMTAANAADLLSRIDPKSVSLLRTIAANGGYATWSEMQAIFGYSRLGWKDFSMHHGRGITNAFRKVIGGDIDDKLIVWNDSDPAWDDTAGWVDGKVYITGTALESLKSAFLKAEI